MPSLSLQKWVRFEPSIPGNRELPEAERFFVDLCAGATMVEFDAMMERFNTCKVSDLASLADVLSPFIRLGKVPLLVDEKPVATVAEMLAAFAGQRGQPLWWELFERLTYLNRIEGAREVFCVGPSGGSSTTPTPSNGSSGSATAAR